jgi:hypothetical protein
MILSETSPFIRATPSTIFAFFAQMDANYLRFHPDHVEFRWLDPPALQPGVRFYFAERVGGKLLKKTVAFTRVEPPSLIEFAPTNVIFRFFLPRITFRISSTAEGITVTQEIQLRIGPLATWLNRRELDAVRLHMRQEGDNLKRLLERHDPVNL